MQRQVSSRGGGGRLKTVKLDCTLREGEVKITGEEKIEGKRKKTIRKKKKVGKKELKFIL